MHLCPLDRSRVLLVLLALGAILVIASSCALVDPGRASRSSFERIEQAAMNGELESAYEELIAFHERHPDARESREAFRLAAAVYKRLYFRDRNARPEARWVVEGAEPLFAWFEDLVRANPDASFPQAEAEALFLGLHFGFVRQYESFAAGSEALSLWRLTFEKDNGIVYSVTAIDHQAPHASDEVTTERPGPGRVPWAPSARMDRG